MPRRRHRRHYEGGGSGCCGCCRYWNQDEEEVAQEYIKRRAKSSPVARLLCCDCDRGYDRHNVQRGYILAGIAFGLLFVITMGYSGNVYEPARYLSTFRKSVCTVDEVEYSKNLTDECHYTGKGRGDKGGWRRFKCLRIHVTFMLNDKVNGNTSKFTAVIADGYKYLEKGKYSLQCTTRPRNCQRYGDMDEDSYRMARYYKDVIGDGEFKCLYNPEALNQVVVPEDHDLAKARSYIILLALVTAVLGLLLVFMCCSCGCQYVCASRVPQEIQQEVQKRRAENQGLTAGDPAAGGGPVIYVGQPMQMVPATGVVQPPAAAPGPQPLPMQPGPPPMGPQYGQYPPPAQQPGYYPQGQYPTGQYPPPQPQYPPPQPGYPPMQGQYPPPQPAAYPPQQLPPAAPQPAGPPPRGVPEQPTAPAPAYQPPAYSGFNAEASELPAKPPME